MNTIYQQGIRLCIFLILFMVSSCKKSFLDIVPKGKQIASTVKDYDLLFNNAELSRFTGATSQLTSGDELMVYDPAFAILGSSKIKNSFLWADIIYDQPDQDAQEMSTFMKPLYNYNKIINEVMTATDGTDQQRKAIKAEALANRAWCYMMLINYYGKPYKPGNSGTDPGYPIITESDVTISKYSRGTVQEVYDFMVNDLKAAIPDLSTQVTSKIRINKCSAQALLGKVYWYMGKYSDALVQFNEAFENLSKNTGIPVRLYNLATAMAPGGVYDTQAASDPFTLYISSPTNDDEALLLRTVTNDLVLGQEYVLADWARALYDGSDLRINFFTPYVFFSVIDDPIFNNENGDIRRYGPLSINIGMTLPDLYLMRAECNARTNHFDQAREDLLFLRKTRMSITTGAAVPANLTEKQLVQFVLDERLREFAQTGYRWFDMRRISVDPMFDGVTFTHIYKKSTGPQTLTLKPERLTFRFPQKVINQNPGMVNNP